jgi:hypothetical protein
MSLRGQRDRTVIDIDTFTEEIATICWSETGICCYLDVCRGGTGLSLSPSGRAVSGCLATSSPRREGKPRLPPRRRTNYTLGSPVGVNPDLLGREKRTSLPEGTPSHRGKGQSQQVGIVQLGRFAVSCRWWPGARGTVRRQDRASDCTGKGKPFRPRPGC